MIIEKKLTISDKSTPSCLTDTELFSSMSGSADARFSKIKRLVQRGQLLHLKRGLYCLASDQQKPHPFTMAQHIYGPSYVSFESALSYHQLIPEAVHTITNACTKRSQNFTTPLGTFSYARLPNDNFYVSVQLEKINNETFLIATPWKAICDYIYHHKKDWRSIEPLSTSLRIEPEDLPIIQITEADLLIEYYQSKRIDTFLREIQKAL